MTARIALLLLAVAMAGCKKEALKPTQILWPSKPAAEELTPAKKVELLRSEAKKRGLHWDVFCVPGFHNEPNHYQGNAYQDGAVDYGGTDHEYIEDGVRDWWSETADSAEDAAYALYQSIQEAPNMHPEHRPIVEPSFDSKCDYNIVLDSKHKGAIPCRKP